MCIPNMFWETFHNFSHVTSLLCHYQIHILCYIIVFPSSLSSTHCVYTSFHAPPPSPRLPPDNTLHVHTSLSNHNTFSSTLIIPHCIHFLTLCHGPPLLNLLLKNYHLLSSLLSPLSLGFHNFIVFINDKYLRKHFRTHFANETSTSFTINRFTQNLLTQSTN